MKKYLLIIFLLSFQNVLRAQINDSQKDSVKTEVPRSSDAEYPGGIAAFFDFLNRHFVYPPKDLKERNPGKVVVSFTVEKDGSLTNIIVNRGSSSAIYAEALRVMKLSSNWKPAIKNGRPVKATYTFPVTFNLPDLPVVQDGLDSIYATTEEEPHYPGGQMKLLEYIETHIRYPDTSRNNDKFGKVIAMVVVEKDGSLSNIKVVTAPDQALGEEAIRLIRSIPEKFIPAKQNDKLVRSVITIPILFQLTTEIFPKLPRKP